MHQPQQYKKRLCRSSVLAAITCLLLNVHVVGAWKSRADVDDAITLDVCSTSGATFVDAQYELRARRSAGHRGTITIQLCDEGNLLADHGQIVLGAADSGVDSGPTVLRGGGTTLDPGVRVTGWTKLNSSSLWQARLPAGVANSRQLWVNGRRAARAHANPTSCSGGPTPGPDPCLPLLRHSATITPTGYANVTSPLNVSVAGPPDLQHWLLPGTEFVYGKGASVASWTEPRCAVTRVVPAVSPGMVDIEMAQPCWARATGKSAPLPWGTGQAVNFPTDIENAYALLTDAGEWFANFSSRVISYYPLPSDDMLTADTILGGIPGTQHEASPTRPGHYGMMDSLLKVDVGARHIQIEQLRFQHHTWLMPSTGVGYVDTQSGWACMYGDIPIKGYPVNSSMGTPFLGCGDAISGQLSAVPGTVHIHGAYDISIRNCTFAHLGRSAIVTDGGSQNITLEDNVIWDVSGGAISLGNTSQPMLNPSKIDGSIVAARNRIRLTGQEFSGAAGIFAGYVAHTQIRNNDIANTSNGAVTLGWGWGATNTMQNNSVTSNKIVRSNTQLFDCGSIYTLSAQPHSEIAYNYIVNQVLLFGSLYHDAHSAYFHTHHNVVSGGPMWLYLQGPPCCGQSNVSNITVESNWHNQKVAGGCNSNGISCKDVWVVNNTLVSGDSWPAEALAVAAAAGIPSSGARTKTDDPQLPPAKPIKPPSELAGRSLSRREHVLAPTPWALEVTDGGAAAITIGTARFDVTSQFSEPGPLWNNLTTARPTGSLGWRVQVNRSLASAGTWTVTASTRTFALRRKFQLVPPPPQKPQKLLVNDTITSKAPATIGMNIRHYAALVSSRGEVDSAAVPGRINAGACGTEENAGHEGTTPFHPTNFGRPDAGFNPTSGAALGLVALDDAFRAHAQARNFAVEKMNPRTPGTCEVHSPPEMRLSDPMLAIAALETHTVEWMLIPQGSNCSTYFCFINKLRHEMGTDTITVGENAGTENQLGNSPSFRVRDGAHAGNQLGWNGTGYTTTVPTSTPGSDDARCKMPDGTYCPIWTSDWSRAQLQQYFEYQGVSVIPTGNGWSSCKMPQQAHSMPRGCRRPQNGREFLEDSPDLDAWLRVPTPPQSNANLPMITLCHSQHQ